MSSKPTFFQTVLFTWLSASLALAGCSGSARRTSAAGGTGEVQSISVTETIETTGNLSADKLTTLKWGTSGVVEQVNVKVGDQVKINEVLAGLRLDSVPAEVVTGQSELATAQRDLQDMLDSGTSLAQAQLAVVNARKEVEEAENNLAALDYARASDTYIKNLEAQILEAEKALTLATRRYKEVQHHYDGDTAKTQAILNMTNAQMSLNTLKATLNYVTAQATQADYDEADAELEVARAALEDARRKRDNVKDGADPLKVAAAQGKVDAAQATVNTMFVIAPFEGEVISVQAGVGNSVKSGEAALELVDRNTLKVETLIDESSITSVQVGNPAEITLESLPGVILPGQVARISRIGTTVNGLVKYTVVVTVDPTDQPVLFGGTVTVVITTGEPHPMLAVPISAVQTDTTGEYVTLVTASGSQRVAIESGDLLDNLVTITILDETKMQAGDQVRLGSSSASTTNNSNQGGGGGGIMVPGAGGPP